MTSDFLGAFRQAFALFFQEHQRKLNHLDLSTAPLVQYPATNNWRTKGESAATFSYKLISIYIPILLPRQLYFPLQHDLLLDSVKASKDLMNNLTISFTVLLTKGAH